MRIIGEIPHHRLKISIFKNDDRISIKFENRFYEQIFKMQAAIANVEEAKRFVDDIFIENVEKTFILMHQNRVQATEKMQTNEDNEFEEII
jgi:hypothetical protein